MKFICTDCNYKFKSEIEVRKRCPYCGKDTVIKEPSAEDLVND